ncbi:MAG: hypothetical protein IT377_15680 [Polyangiaceae bacterium]|nr:hypothetical protein [Polyangiaceae bacterium]
MLSWKLVFRHCLAFLVAALATQALVSCSPEPRFVSCRIDSECRERGGKFRYCVMNRCVECVGSSACGYGKMCNAGVCESK